MDTWETPQYLFDELNEEFKFVLDVCADPNNAKCSKYYTKADDALLQDWDGTCWCNPPYGRQTAEWIHKAYNESQRGATVVCLVPNRTETDWWHDYALKGEIRFIRGRVHFVGGGRPRFGSVIIVFRPNEELRGSSPRRVSYE